MTEPSFTYVFRLGLHDTDAAGVMFFAHLFRHAHDAYEAFMEHIGFALPDSIKKMDYRLPLVNAQANYHAPIYHGDRVLVCLDVEKIGQRAFTLSYRFIKRENNMLLADAKTVHVYHSQKDASPALPEALRLALQGKAKG